jgi:hypothetical protein
MRCPPRSVYNRGAQMTHRTRFHDKRTPRLRHRGATSSLSTARAETPRHRDRPREYTPHVRSYPAHAYPIQNVATALQSTHSGRHAFSRQNAARHRRHNSARDLKYGSYASARVGGGRNATQACSPTREAHPPRSAVGTKRRRRCELFRPGALYRYTNSDCFHRQID